MTINKTSFEKRLYIVKEVLETKKSRNFVVKENNLSCTTVRDWIDRYQTFGENGLRPYKIKAKYSTETKQNAVEEVLYQGASQRTVMKFLLQLFSGIIVNRKA